MTKEFMFYLSENALYYSDEYLLEDFQGIVHELIGQIVTEFEKVEFHGQHIISHLDIEVQSGRTILLNSSGVAVKSVPLSEQELSLFEEFIYRHFHTM
jgi:hypothetical protein